MMTNNGNNTRHSRTGSKDGQEDPEFFKYEEQDEAAKNVSMDEEGLAL